MVSEPHYEPTETAKAVLEKRYLLKDDEGKIIETPGQMFRRVARVIAAVDASYDADEAAVKKLEDEFFRIMCSLQFLPNSPTLMNAGAPLGQLSACFVLPVPDSIEGIFEALKRMAVIFKTGGGVGFSFSRLRPRGTMVASSKGEASGPVSFMSIFNEANGQIKQGGKRRGAMMGMLRVDHPDILEFIEAKFELGQLENLNMSVAVTDKFMQAVEMDGQYDLLYPKDGKLIRKLRAKEVWQKIVHGAWKNGEPGLFFLDRVNSANPTPDVGMIEGTNPCVSADTWTMTEAGPRLVSQLVDCSSELIVAGVAYPTSGFYKTGRKKIYLISTKEGFSVEATKEHRFLHVKRETRNKIDTEWLPVSELSPGSRIMLMAHEPRPWNGRFTKDDGYLVGLWFGDGYLNKRAVLYWYKKKQGGKKILRRVTKIAKRVRTKREKGDWTEETASPRFSMRSAYLTKLLQTLSIDGKKVITPELEQTSYNFYLGFLRGFFDTDGSVQGTQEKGVSVRLSQSNLSRLQAVQRMLLRIGIVSKIFTFRRPAGMRRLPDGHGGYKMYWCKAQHELVISSDAIERFMSLVGFENTAQKSKLSKLLKAYKRVLNIAKPIVRVKSVTSMGVKSVYDIQVPGINSFDANGLVAHNCGEQPLLPNESCNLGSINLGRMVTDNDETNDTISVLTVAWDRLKTATRLAVHFLDNVIEANKFPISEIEQATKANRKIGLGVMGWAEMLVQLGVQYDSEDAIIIAKSVMGTISKAAREESELLAVNRGAFPNFDHSIFKGGKARRNATLTTIAPNGSIGIIADAHGGIEPLFTVGLHRRSILDGDKEFFSIHSLFEKMAREQGWYSEDLMKKVAQVASIQKIEEIPAGIRKLFRTAHDVSPSWHVEMQAAFQEYVENAISKTINLPKDATEQDVERAFQLAYKLGCKGGTVYRDGSRSGQPLASAETDKKDKDDWEYGHIKMRPRPEVLEGRTYKKRTGCGTIFITITRDEGNRPLELFAKAGKAGVCSQAQCEAIGRLVSLALRSGVEPKEVAKQLGGITCQVQYGFKEKKILSCSDAIAKALLGEIAPGKEINPKQIEVDVVKDEEHEGFAGRGSCPDCGAALVSTGECAYCRVCGFNECT